MPPKHQTKSKHGLVTIPIRGFNRLGAMIFAALLAVSLGGWGGASLFQPSAAKAQTTRHVSTETLLQDCGSPINISLVQWPQTDFTRCTVSLEEILSGGIGRDGIPAIDDVTIIPVAEETTLAATEPVISLVINEQARAWPLRYLIWHEIANDTLGDIPIAVTYCPLCNAALVFDRRHDGEILDFGTTGNLRKSDLVMYDRQSETWWQQYTDQGIIGQRAGEQLAIFASRLEDWQSFKIRHPDGTVLVATNPNVRPYGANPYRGYDTSGFPFLYQGDVPKGIAPLDRVVVVEGKAWALDYIKSNTPLNADDLVITWRPGQNSALDERDITQGRDIGTVTVTRKNDISSKTEDVAYDVTFAFVFHAFMPDQQIIQD